MKVLLSHPLLLTGETRFQQDRSTKEEEVKYRTCYNSTFGKNSVDAVKNVPNQHNTVTLILKYF